MSKNILKDIEDDFNNELYEHHRLIVDKNQSAIRIDKYLFNRLEKISRTKIQSAADAGSILVNDKPVSSNYKIKPDDTISIVLPNPVREIELIAQDIPLDVVYEDEDVVVINKQPNIVVHPGVGNYDGTLLNALLYYFEKTKQTNAKPYLVHRIDKNTTGLLIIAKNEFAQSFLSKQFFDRTISRLYNALVWGGFDEDAGKIVGNLSRDIRDRKKMAVFEDNEIGKYAATNYKVIKEFTFTSLVECKLDTGRTHQIRVHFEYIKHPIFNDDIYGGNRMLKGINTAKYKQFIQNCFDNFPRYALHSKYLKFVHPNTKKEISIEQDIPLDFKALLEKWNNFTNNF